MPELAEVEFIRKRWSPGLGQRIKGVRLHPKAGVFRGTNPATLIQHLTGATLLSSEAAAKQMLFLASGDVWLGLHLGMTGELSVQPAGYTPRAADHLVLDQATQALVFSDFRMFGRVQFSVGPEVPAWWSGIAPVILSKGFTREAVATFLRRRARSPIKAVLLMQERFPGVGNWMADEILWRAGVHPRQPAGSLNEAEIATLHREIRWVADRALKTIGETFVDPPKTWLFPHRWQDGGRCPKTGKKLIREEIGGRTTCWSPGRQRLR
ncbi:formamidopyrimidine-DNA glycosylase [Opitutaceae bacterium]